MLKVIALVLAVVSLSLADDRSPEWLQWEIKHNKTYRTAQEEASKRAAWERNYNLVRRHNEDTSASFTLEMNRFADEEKSSRPLQPLLPRNSTSEKEIQHNWTFIPSSFDWRTKGAISPVKTQGQLSGAFVMAATDWLRRDMRRNQSLRDLQNINECCQGLMERKWTQNPDLGGWDKTRSKCMESYEFIKTGKFTTVSESELVDCCTHSPWVVTPIFNCIHGIGGLCSAASYPSVTGDCRNTTCTPVIQIKGGQTVPRGREDQLQLAVLHFPVMALIDASRASFMVYRSGIYDDPGCSSTQLDHAVQIVGYGSQDGKDFWIVRNSWGTDWGMNGYILMSRNKNNQCGIATEASYPV